MSKRKHTEIQGAGQTVVVKLADVPQYLQNGELFKSMQAEAAVNEEEASECVEQIEVPVNCIKPDQTVSSVDDAWSLLHSLRYWIVGSELPPSLVTFCLSPSGKERPASFWKSFERNYAHMGALRRMTASNARDPSAKVRIAITTGDVSLVRLVHETLQCDLPSTACTAAVQSGSLACLQYVHERMAGELKNVVKTAIDMGSLDFAKFAVSKGHEVSQDACIFAAKRGSVSCIGYLRTLPDVIWDDRVCLAAAHAGHLDCLK
jgi:hypothetical protein